MIAGSKTVFWRVILTSKNQPRRTCHDEKRKIRGSTTSRHPHSATQPCACVHKKTYHNHSRRLRPISIGDNRLRTRKTQSCACPPWKQDFLQHGRLVWWCQRGHILPRRRRSSLTQQTPCKCQPLRFASSCADGGCSPLIRKNRSQNKLWGSIRRIATTNVSTSTLKDELIVNFSWWQKKNVMCILTILNRRNDNTAKNDCSEIHPPRWRLCDQLLSYHQNHLQQKKYDFTNTSSARGRYNFRPLADLAISVFRVTTFNTAFARFHLSLRL